MSAAALPRSSLIRLFRNGDLVFTIGLFGTILLMILPIGPFLLDGFLSISLALSLLILLVILYVREPHDFTGFPTLLLFITLFRLALNIASTRLILIDGYAGHIIEEALLLVGDALGRFHGPGWFTTNVKPLVESLQRLRDVAPLPSANRR